MFSQVPTKLKGLLDGLEKLDTEDERGGKPNPEAKRAFVPETPSADGEGFEDRVCREMGASLFRYKAFVPFTFFHDVKAWIQVRHAGSADPNAAPAETRQFVISFVYCFCTTAGPVRAPISQQPMLMALSRMSETVKGNKTLEVRLNSFIPLWKEGATPAAAELLLQAKKVSIPLPLLANLEKEMSKIMAWKDPDRMDTEAD